MKEKLLLIDIDRCVRCFACEVACKQEHSLPPGPRWNSVVTVGPREAEGNLYQDFVFATCVQCAEPACCTVCTAGALSKQEDGLVKVDEARCKKCGLCVLACPHGAIHLRPDTGVAWKCDQCAERVVAGLPPACVQHCVGGSLQYLAESEAAAIAGPRHEARFGKVVYVSSRWKLDQDL
jgi:Fe-S-cluster-containing dehydrogenase component